MEILSCLRTWSIWRKLLARNYCSVSVTNTNTQIRSRCIQLNSYIPSTTITWKQRRNKAVLRFRKVKGLNICLMKDNVQYNCKVMNQPLLPSFKESRSSKDQILEKPEWAVYFQQNTKRLKWKSAISNAVNEIYQYLYLTSHPSDTPQL